MNEEDKALQTLRRENQKIILGLNHQLAMEGILLEEKKVTTETAQQVAIIKAREKQSIKIIEAEAKKAQAENNAKKEAEAILADSKAYSQAKTIETEANRKALEFSANARLEVA